MTSRLKKRLARGQAYCTCGQPMAHRRTRCVDCTDLRFKELRAAHHTKALARREPDAPPPAPETRRTR